MNPLLVASALSGLVAAGVAAWGMYEWQEGRYAQKELEHVERHDKEAAEARVVERNRAAGVQAAQNDATRRLAALRADANTARDAVDSLRDATASVLKHADTSLQACTVTAAALGAVFNKCSKEYQELAEAADRHAADTVMLDKAWPE